MNQSEKFWADSQSETVKKLSNELEKNKDLSLDLLKTILTIHATIFGITVALIGYLQKSYTFFLVTTWITEIVSIALGLLCFKLHIDIESKNTLDGFMFSYDMNKINTSYSQGKFSGKDEERHGLIIAAMVRRTPSGAWESPLLNIAKKYAPQLPSSKLFTKNITPSTINKFLLKIYPYLINIFYTLTSLSFLFLLLSIFIK